MNDKKYKFNFTYISSKNKNKKKLSFKVNSSEVPKTENEYKKFISTKIREIIIQEDKTVIKGDSIKFKLESANTIKNIKDIVKDILHKSSNDDRITSFVGQESFGTLSIENDFYYSRMSGKNHNNGTIH